MNQPRRIALAFQLGAPYQERITHGISDYSREHGPWEIVSSPEGSALPLESLATWKGDGVIAMLETSAQVEWARSIACPVVNLATSIATPGFPTVSGDNRAIGRLAATHLMKRNFQRFGFYGLHNVAYSVERQHGFLEELRRQGFSSEIHLAESSLLSDTPWKLNRTELQDWISQLDTPCGIFAVHDYRARMVLEACSSLGRKVPDEIAVIGVDDDPVVCEYSAPRLTSIRQDGFLVGREAAGLLDRLMAGDAPGESTIVIPPDQVVERRSTQTIAVENPVVREAINLIEKRYSEPIDIAWICREMNVSRRKLERTFRDQLRTSPLEFLSRHRVHEASILVRSDAKTPLTKIARQCGFTDTRRMNAAFLRETGKTPRDVRSELSA